MNRGVLAIGMAVTLPILGLLLLNINRNPTAIRSPLINKPSPDAVLQNLNGGAPLRLASLRGRPVVVNFWASWCVPCVEEHASLIAGARANPDVAFLGVVYEDAAENARAFLSEHGKGYESYEDTDGKAAIAFGIYGVPETYFIDAKGVIVDKYVGPLDEVSIQQKLQAARR